VSTAATVPTIAASASWSSSVPVTLANNSSAATPIIQAANSSGAAENITLSGALTGAGGLTDTGAGKLTLSASSSYTGVTNANGNLIVSGSLSGTTAVNVAGILEVDGSINSAATITTAGGTLDGRGLVGPVNANGGTLAPGFGSSATDTNFAGNLTAAGNVTLSGSTTFSIRLGVSTGSPDDVDSLSITGGGTVALNSATLTLTTGSHYVAPALDTVYVILNGGYSQLTSGTFANGSTLNASNGNVYQILYGWDPGTSSVDGSGADIAVEYVAAVPEPGTWATMLAGLGVLGIWQRARRNGRRNA
jgi:autotransporter-associated beta strand protein